MKSVRQQSAKLQKFRSFQVESDTHKKLTGKEVPVRNIEREMRRSSDRHGHYYSVKDESKTLPRNYFNTKTRAYCIECHLAMGIAEAAKGNLCSTCIGRMGS